MDDIPMAVIYAKTGNLYANMAEDPERWQRVREYALGKNAGPVISAEEYRRRAVTCWSAAIKDGIVTC